MELRPSPGTGGSSSGLCPPPVLSLDDERATDEECTGTKAAALARAAAAGMPVVPGFVLTTSAAEDVSAGGELPRAAVDAWRDLSEEGRRPLVVRSSSTVEDLGGSSMAGRFESVVGVRGADGFRNAVQRVIHSREQAAAGSDVLTGREPIAVLVQPLMEARCGGVLFGIDPVSGREDRLVAAVVEGGPDRLVSGEVDGSRYELDTAGGVIEVQRGDGGRRLSRRQLRSLAALAARTAELYGGPQDVEWLYDTDGRLRLLQSRPVTAQQRGRPRGPVFGPGPVAETFPEPLQPLEADLWAEPLRTALRHALSLAGTASAADLDASPLVTVTDGWVAVDLDLLEPRHRAPTVWERLDPRPRLRRLHVSWRVGRLRAALPSLARDVLDAADRALAEVPTPADLSDGQLVGLLHRLRPALVATHTHELLIGLLAAPGTSATTGAGTALAALARARQAGLDDADVVAHHPVVLALSPPQVRDVPILPAEVPAPAPTAPGRTPDGGGSEGPSGVIGEHSLPGADDPGLLREALRLRARWLQELGARAGWLLGQRLAAAGRLPHAEDVRGLGMAELAAAVDDPAGPVVPRPVTPGEPLPARFQISDTGCPVTVGGGAGATGAGGGSGRGPVHHGQDPPEGAVLVVRTLDPGLAPVLPRLAGLVAETGSVLAHLAILAREAGVPTVVGLSGALDRFPPGTVVDVDGTTGEVQEEEDS